MSDQSSEKLLVEMIPSKEGEISALASAQAPIIFLDNAPIFGYYNGIMHVTLEMARRLPDANPNGVVMDRVITGDLMMNLEAATNLRAALDGAILMATPTPEGQAH